MAQKVKYNELSDKCGLIAVHPYHRPFTKEEIISYTNGLEKYALVQEGEHLFIYGE